MPLMYLDSSALVKRYVSERGSAWVARLCQREPVAVSLLAIPEVAAAFARRTREGALTVEQRDLLFRTVLRDAQALILVALTQTIIQQATTLLLTAPPPVRLRTLDAVHVASARVAFARAWRRGVATGDFVAADQALLDAARRAGLATRHPEESPDDAAHSPAGG